MAQYSAPHHQQHADDDAGYSGLVQAVAWTVLIALAFSPRLCILGFWIFGHQLGDAFSGWITPALGFFLLPWTTVAYVFMWGIASDGVSGWEWIVVGVSFLGDVLLWLWLRAGLRE